MKAAEENYTDITKLLLGMRADVDAKNSRGRTPLSFAVSTSMGREVATETLLLLLQAGADPSQEDKLGMTAKQRATHEKRTEALKILIDFEKRAHCTMKD